MKTITKRVFAIAGVLALGLTAVKAQTDGALLDALVKKGVLSDQEAEDIRASAAKDYATTAAGKLSLPDYVSSVKIYGDVRYRFEYLDEKPQSGATVAGGATQGDNVVERNRYRLRVGLDYVFTDNFKGGIELESNTANDSANQTMGNAYGKSAINIGLVYLQWKPVDWLTLTGGKQRNPLYTTDLVWDPDINPEGGSEVASWTFPIDFGSSAPASTDPKAIVAPSEPSNMSLTVGFTGFQGIYADNQEFNPTTSGGALANATDVWQFVEQVPVQFNFSKDMFIKEVPGFDTYTSGGNFGSSFGNVATNTLDGGGGTQNFEGPNIADHLQIVTAPGEFDWKMWDQPFKLYWDFAANLDGKARVQDVLLGNNQAGIAQNTLTQAENRGLGDNIAWVAGLQVGQNKKKGDWSVKGDYRQVGLGAIDPNLNDSDWADSFLNQQGIKLASTYNFTDFLTGTITYYDTWAYKTNLMNGSPGQTQTGLPLAGGAGGYSVNSPTTGITGLVAASTVQRVDIDLQWKF
jgi:Putative porin